VPKVVYNLEFPYLRQEMPLGGYRFYRAEDYRERLKSLQHLVSCHGEFYVPATTGGHALTAFVESPANELPAVLSPYPGNTALADIILLLGLFTGRDVFVEEGPVDGVIMADPRESRRIGNLRCAIPYRRRTTPTRDGAPSSAESEDVAHMDHTDVGFEEDFNRVYAWIQSEEWQRLYRTGHFIFLAKSALQPNHPLGTAYTQCWTVWEHLHGLHHREIREGRKHTAVEKIRFLLREYGLKEVQDEDLHRLRPLTRIRNSLVHEGTFPDYPSVWADAKLFIELTGSLLASVLRLTPTNFLNTSEGLDKLLTRSEPVARPQRLAAQQRQQPPQQQPPQQRRRRRRRGNSQKPGASRAPASDARRHTAPDSPPREP
jgi:hypothetical protein